MRKPLIAIALWMAFHSAAFAQLRDSCTLGKAELMAPCATLKQASEQLVGMTDMDAWFKAYETVTAAHPANEEDKGANVEMLRRGEVMLQRLKMIEYKKPFTDKLEALISAYAKRIGGRRMGEVNTQ